MQITLNQSEIHDAVEAYVRNQINIKTDQSISIDFTMGRGDNGLSAALDIRTKVGISAKPVVARSNTTPPAPQPKPAPADEEEGDSAPDADLNQSADETPEPSAKGNIFGKKTKVSDDREESSDVIDEGDSQTEAPETPKRSSIFSKAG